MRRPKDKANWQKQTWHITAFATQDKLYYKPSGCSKNATDGSNISAVAISKLVTSNFCRQGAL